MGVEERRVSPARESLKFLIKGNNVSLIFSQGACLNHGMEKRVQGLNNWLAHDSHRRASYGC